jgi:HD-like signal output (HDOD) protein
MQTNKIPTLLAGIDTIPTLPAIVGQVTATIACPKSSARDLMEIIAPDQALTLKILKIANSAFYGRVRRVGTLDQALMALGFDEVRNIVVSTAVFNSFRRLRATALFDPGKFWEHAFMCGLAGRIIAKKTDLSDGELFVAGLIHDIGKLAICMVLPQEFDMVIQMSGSSNPETSSAELQILGITHAEIGAQILKRWMLPQDLIEAVGYHHRPAAAPVQTAYPIVTHLADLLAHNPTVMDAPDGGQHGDGWLTTDIIDLARSHGILNGYDTLNKFAEELKAQKEAQVGILEIFLS